MIYTLTGPNSFALQAQLQQLQQAFLAQYDAMGLERLDASEVSVERLQEALHSLPFLAERKLVVIRSGADNKPFAADVEKLLTDVPDSSDVILVEPKLDKRLGYYKFLKKATTLQEFVELDASGLARWLADTAKARGGSLSGSDARYLVERTGLNQQGLSLELDKLLAYQPQIDRPQIDLLSEPSPQGSVFDLLEAAFAGKRQRTFQLYNAQREQKVEPQQIIAMLTWQLHVLALLKVAGQSSPETVAKESKLSPYVVKKSVALARSLSTATVRQLIASLLTLDRRLKRESLDADEYLRTYLLELTKPEH